MLFRRPLYQRGTVTAHRRELPDVSLLADIIPGYAVFCTALGDCINSENTDPWQAVGGTSAGTPLLAGGFALVDEMLRRDRRQPLGLVNPLLYRIGRSAPGPQAFFDVRAYGNDVGPYIPGNGRPLGCCNARPGYDEASGWGSLNLASFAAQAAVLQPPQIHLYIPPHQHPLARRAIVATVSCAAACRLAAAAVVRIAGARRFVVVSRTFGLDTSGARRVLIDFSAGQLRRLRVAARRRRRATAIVFGVLVSPSGRIVSETPGKRVRIVR
jgi:hypothetical protein